MMAVIDMFVQLIQTRNFSDIKVFYENGYLNWYDIIVSGILMWV